MTEILATLGEGDEGVDVSDTFSNDEGVIYLGA